MNSKTKWLSKIWLKILTSMDPDSSGNTPGTLPTFVEETLGSGIFGLYAGLIVRTSSSANIGKPLTQMEKIALDSGVCTLLNGENLEEISTTGTNYQRKFVQFCSSSSDSLYNQTTLQYKLENITNVEFNIPTAPWERIIGIALFTNASPIPNENYLYSIALSQGQTTATSSSKIKLTKGTLVLVEE